VKYSDYMFIYSSVNCVHMWFSTFGSNEILKSEMVFLYDFVMVLRLYDIYVIIVVQCCLGVIC